MTLEDFMGLDRLPTAHEFISLCGEIGIGFGNNEEGKPVLRAGSDNKVIAHTLAKLLRREPWRTQVITAKELNASKPSKPADAKPWKDVSKLELLYPDGTITQAADDNQPSGSQATHFRVLPQKDWIGIPPVPKLDPEQWRP